MGNQLGTQSASLKPVHDDSDGSVADPSTPPSERRDGIPTDMASAPDTIVVDGSADATYDKSVCWDRLHAAIKGQRDERDLITFTPDELISTALLINGGPMPIDWIRRWVEANFVWFNPASERHAVDDDIREPIQKFRHILGRGWYEVMQAALEGRVFLAAFNCLCRRAKGFRTLRYITGFNERQGSFRFLDLPVEIREDILARVFYRGYAVSAEGRGFMLEYRSAESCMRSMRLSCYQITHWHSHYNIGCILRPLLTCRQIYQEAMPLFARTNHFCFHSIKDIRSFFESTGEVCWLYWRELSVRFHVRDRSADVDFVFDRLSKIKSLRVLHIHFNESVGVDATGLGGPNRICYITELPGYDGLQTICGLQKVTFHGCPILESDLKEDMLAPRRAH